MRKLYNKECDRGNYVNQRNPEQVRLEKLREKSEKLTRRGREANPEPTPAEIKERQAKYKYDTAFYAVLRANPGKSKEWCARKTRELLGIRDPVKRTEARKAQPVKAPIFYRVWNAATAAAYNIVTGEEETAVQYR